MSDYTSYLTTDLTTGELHRCLLTGIAPRPIAFVSTIDRAGRVNLSPYSFFNIFGSNPPLVIFSPARRVRDNSSKHTLENVREVAECVVNIVDYPMVQQMSLASTEYPKGVNEFIKSGLTQVQADVVAAPRVGESPLAMECKVQQIIETGQEGGAGNLVIAEIIKIHLRNTAIGENGLLSAEKLDLVGRMGSSYYVRASGDALFEVPKPSREHGIGVDQLPEATRHSRILTGNDLARLGSITSLPTPEEIAALAQDDRCQLFRLATLKFTSPNATEEIEKARHLYAQELIAQGKSRKALSVLMAP
ncbi:MAG: flavin reductase family protein [Bacteroidota bacterium]